MKAAQRCGLNTPDVRLRSFIDKNGFELDCLEIIRYDRVEQKGKIRRLHQEDLCQGLSIVSSRKYTQDGGPGFDALFQFTRNHTKPSAIHQNELVGLQQNLWVKYPKFS